jgi:hypothetical protein
MGGGVDRRIVERVIPTLRVGDTFDTCCLFQTQPFQPGVMPSSFHGLAVFLGGNPSPSTLAKFTPIDSTAHGGSSVNVKRW